jgi:hypothetical protein
MVEDTTFRKLKKALLEMLRGYPEYGFYGKLDFFLPKTKLKNLPPKNLKNPLFLLFM